MILTEIYVENNQVDVNADISTLLTYAIDDVKDFAARNTTFSKTIVVPGTARNNKLFGNIFSVNSASFYDDSKPNIGYNYNAAKSASCYMFMGGIQIFKGIFRILSIVIDKGRIEYECAVFGELGGLISKIGNKLLQDLDFSAYVHSYTEANIINSWTAPKGLGYYYPLIDYGTYSTNKHDWDIRTFRPALYVKEYIDKIFAASGYTYQCDLFNTARFKTLIIPHNTKQITRLSKIGFEVTKGELLYTVIGSYSEQLQFSNHTTLGNFVTSDSRVYNYQSGTPLTGKLFVNLSFHLTGSQPVNSFQVGVYRNNIAIGSETYSTPNADQYGNIVIEIDSVQFNQNDNLYCYLQINQSGSLDILAADLKIESDLATVVPIAPGEGINMNDLIPKNIRQTDFLASIIKLFNLYIYEDKDVPNKLLITPYPEFFDTSLTSTRDWTNKIDLSQPIGIKPMSELTARYYHFKYADDSDFYNEQYRKRYNANYGDYIFDTAFEFAEESQDTEIIFSGTPLVGYQGEDKVYPTIFKSSNGNEETIDSNIRIMQSKIISSVSSWNLKDGLTVLASLTSYGYAGHLDDPDAPSNDLNFGAPYEFYFILAAGAINVNQFNVYWSPYLSEITDKDSRLLTAYARLTTMDINTLDFSKYVSIDGVLWVINKVEDYNAAYPDLCKITLLKVIDSNAIASAPTNIVEDLYLSQPMTGTEGTTYYSARLQNIIITFLVLGDKVLYPSGTPAPGVNEYYHDPVSGTLIFGVDIQALQVLQLLYKTA